MSFRFSTRGDDEVVQAGETEVEKEGAAGEVGTSPGPGHKTGDQKEVCRDGEQVL